MLREWRVEVVGRMKPSFVFLFLFYAMCVGATDANAQLTDGLWVTFEVDGQIGRALVSEAAAQEYVRRFVAGQRPHRVPTEYADRWLHAAGLAPPTSALHILRADECRDGGHCTKLNGLYAGRSPSF